MQFSGKNVLVTGAASGIGKEIALTLAGYGLKVWVNYRSRPEQADAIKAEIEANGEIFECENILVATGSKPKCVGGFDFDHEFILSSVDAFSFVSILISSSISKILFSNESKQNGFKI